MFEQGVTFATLLTPEGVVTAAALVTTLVALIKAVFPVVNAKVSGALMAFVLSAALYVLAAASVGTGSLDAGLTVFLAWLACATSAVGIHSTATHVADQR
jgi:hypothetical protein